MFSLYETKKNTKDIALLNSYFEVLENIVSDGESAEITEMYLSREDTKGKELFSSDVSKSGSAYLYELNNKYKNDDDGRHMEAIKTNDEITSVTLPFIDAIKMIIDISSDELFYGALFEENGEMYNPLHPLIAKNIIENLNKYSSDEITVHIFTLKKPMGGKNDEVCQTFNEEIINILSFSENTTYIEKDTSTITINDSKVAITRDNMYDIRGEIRKCLNYCHRVIIGGGKTVSMNSKENDHNIVVPLQLVTFGIAFPYYGTLLLKTNDSDGVLGYDISPMVSANISKCNTVCTGNLNKLSISGWRSLNHCNLKSPYRKNILRENYEEYITESIKVSVELLSTLVDDAVEATEPVGCLVDIDNDFLKNLSEKHLKMIKSIKEDNNE